MNSPLHPIGVVAQRTGLTPDVLRVWERRYGVVTPERTDTGQRLYSDADVERLRLLSKATAAGRSIGQLLELSDVELRELVAADDAATAPPERTGMPSSNATVTIEAALDRARQLDGPGLELLLWRSAMLWGAPAFMNEIAAPLLRRIGDDWHAGRLKVAHEHLATTAIRTILTGIRSELMPSTNAPALLVGTPSESRHEVGALLAAAAAAAEGWRVTYLGPDLPAAEIAAAALDTHSRAVAVSLVYSPDDDLSIREMQFLRVVLPERIPVLAGGAAAWRLAEPLREAGLVVLEDLEALRSWLRTAA